MYFEHNSNSICCDWTISKTFCYSIIFRGRNKLAPRESSCIILFSLFFQDCKTSVKYDGIISVNILGQIILATKLFEHGEDKITIDFYHFPIFNSEVVIYCFVKCRVSCISFKNSLDKYDLSTSLKCFRWRHSVSLLKVCC